MLKLSNIEKIVEDARNGKLFVLVDDENRENEGDLIIPASKINPKTINFMAKYGRGLICLTLSQQQADKLKLPLMSSNNISRSQTAFTVSIDSKKDISTGISAYDRYVTIKKAINKKNHLKILFHRVMFFLLSPKKVVFLLELVIQKHQLIFQN